MKNIMKKEEKAVTKTERAFHRKELATSGKKTFKGTNYSERDLRFTGPKRGPKGRRNRGVPFGQGQMIPRMPGPMPQLGLQSGLGAGVSNPSTGATVVVDGSAAQKDLSSLLNDPFKDTVIGRWPDPNTMMVTATAKDTLHSNLMIYNGTTANDGCVAWYFRGDPFATWSPPTSILSSTASPTPFKINWQAPVTNMNASMATGAYARPTGIGCRLTFNGVGTYHSVVVRIMELPPWGPIASGFTNFPVAGNSSPTYVQKEFFRAREITLNPGEVIQINLYPMEARSIGFADTTAVRDQLAASTTNPSCLSWGGFLFWGFGFSSLDSFYIDAIMHHEYYYPLPTTLTNVASPPKAIVLPDSGARDKAMKGAVVREASGWNIFKNVLTTAAGIASMVLPFMANVGPKPPSVSSSADHLMAEYSEDILSRRMLEGRGGGQRLTRLEFSESASMPTVLTSGPFLDQDGIARPEYPWLNMPPLTDLEGHADRFARRLKYDQQQTDEHKEPFRPQSQSSSSSSGDGRYLDVSLSGRGMAQVTPAVRKQ